MRRLALIIAAAAAVLGLAACTGTPSGSLASGTGGAGGPAAAPSSAPGPGKVGATVPFDRTVLEQRYAGNVTVHSAAWQTTLDSAFGRTPAHGAYLVLDVEVISTAGPNDYNTLYWSAQDAAGRVYTAGLRGLDGELGSGDLPAGQHIRGLVAIDLPHGTVDVRYQPIPLGAVATYAIPG